MSAPEALTLALSAAKQGFRVLPCRPGGKIPVLKDWPNRATCNPLAVAELWAEHGYDCNPGIACGDRLIVVDVDCKDDKRGFESLAAMPSLPATRTVRTPSDGAHIYLRIPQGVRIQNSAGSLADGVDIRATGGQVLAPGSVVGGKPYVLAKDLPIADCPDWLLAKLTEVRVSVNAEAGRHLGALDTPQALACAENYIKTRAPNGFEGARNNSAFIVAERLLDFGISPTSVLPLLLEWNETKCFPPLPDEEIETVCGSASGSSRQLVIGVDNPTVGFEPIEAPPAPNPRDLLEFPEDISLDDVLRQGANALIKGVLNPNEDAVLYGRSGTGKTFVALDLGYALAQGRPWAGRKTRECAVLYVGLEGSGGLQKRFKAIQRKFGTAGRRFAKLKLHISLVKDGTGETGAETIIEAFNALLTISGAETGLIIIDTLARAIAGNNENDSSDMAAFVEHRMTKIRSKARGTPAVLIVHHTNKDGGMRGSEVLRGSADVVLRAEREEDEKGHFTGGARSLFAEKVKDGEEQKLFDYELEKIALGRDTDGDEVTTCLIAVVTDPEAAQIFECEVLVRRLMTERLRAGGKLSPSLHTTPDPTTREERSAVKWLIANGAGAHPVKRIQFVLENNLAAVFPIKRSQGDTGPSWYSLSERAIGSEGVPVQPGSMRFSEEPIRCEKQSKIKALQKRNGSRRKSVRS